MQVEPAKATHVRINIPGPNGQLTLPIITHGARADTHYWSWNGDIDKPTLRPSVLSQAGHYAPNFKPNDDICCCTYYKEHPEEERHFTCYRCHTWINDGNAVFLPDSTHEFAGKTVPLLDVK